MDVFWMTCSARFGVVQLWVLPAFSFSFLIKVRMIFMFESPGSTYGETSTESSITLIAESINKAQKATKTVTMLLKIGGTAP